jgi:hypothetical protein
MNNPIRLGGMVSLFFIMTSFAQVFVPGNFVPISPFGRLGPNKQEKYIFKTPDIINHIIRSIPTIGSASLVKIDSVIFITR